MIRNTELTSGLRSRGLGHEDRSLAQNTPRELDFDPFAGVLESRKLSESPLDEAALIFCVVVGSLIVVGCVIFYAVLRAIGL